MLSLVDLKPILKLFDFPLSALNLIHNSTGALRLALHMPSDM